MFKKFFKKKSVPVNNEKTVINETKQMPGNTLGLSSGVNANGTRPTDCLNCTQMTNEWIDDVLYRMERTSNVATQNLAAEIGFFGINNITKTVSGVQRSTGELIILNIN